MDTVNHNILIVDPILRGSRLVCSSLAVAGFLKQGWTAHLLTRHDASTEHYRELMGNSTHQLHPTIPVPGGVWFEKLSPALVQSCLTEIGRLAALHKITAIFFTGWNEFFPALPLKVWRRPKTARHLPFYAIDYAPSFWLKAANAGSPRDRLKSLAKRMTTKLALERFPTLKFLILDERVLDEKYSALPPRLRTRFAWIADPAPVPGKKTTGEKSPSDLPTVLVVGLQTERKGLIDVVELLEQNPQDLPVRFNFVGRLSKETEVLRSRLLALSSRHFCWSEGFWPEATIQRLYAEADFIILPYTRSFDCSSAVLAMACGHGKPVMTTEHGVIGFRVARHHLGLVYPSRQIPALAETLWGLPKPGSLNYQTLSANCRQFAAANSVEKYQQTLINLISNQTPA
jgi:glycosyltransferase involved in cell wall biosynthesis